MRAVRVASLGQMFSNFTPLVVNTDAIFNHPSPHQRIFPACKNPLPISVHKFDRRINTSEDRAALAPKAVGTRIPYDACGVLSSPHASPT